MDTTLHQFFSIYSANHVFGGNCQFIFKSLVSMSSIDHDYNEGEIIDFPLEEGKGRWSGLFNFFRNKYGMNPFISNVIEIFASSYAHGNIYTILDDITKNDPNVHFYTTDAPSSITIKQNYGKINLKGISFKARNDSPYTMKKFDIQGSNNGSEFKTIEEVDIGSNWCVHAQSEYTHVLSSSSDTYFQFIRIVQKSNNYNNNHLILKSIEFFGKYMKTSQ